MHPPTRINETGAIVVHYTHLSDGGDGFVPNGISLCHIPWNTLHPYAVWTTSLRPEDNEWHTFDGTYCENYADAVVEYQNRGGQVEVEAIIAMPDYEEGSYFEIFEPKLDAIIKLSDDSVALIIAHGHYNEDDPDGPKYAIMAFTDAATRAEHDGTNRGSRNYLVGWWQEGKLHLPRYFSNIVEAADSYSDDYGMDI